MRHGPLDESQTIVSLAPGDALCDRYELVRELGRGGMGVVWLALDLRMDRRQVALKLLPTPLSRDRRSVARLKEEARRSLELTHPNIVRLMNFEQDESRGGLAFLVMQFVEGQTLNDLLADHPKGLPLERVTKWAGQLAAALDYSHSKGVLHRDIKPSNVMIDGEDNAYLMDFGIAREAKDTMTRVTGRDSSGTLPYMSPQQIMGENSKSNDVYSLAVTLYDALNGASPFITGDLVQQIRRAAPPKIPDLPAHVNSALLCGMSKEADARFDSAGELAIAILGVTHDRAIPVPKSRQSPRPGWMFLTKTLGTTILGTAAISGLWWFSHGKRAPQTATGPSAAQVERLDRTTTPDSDNLVQGSDSHFAQAAPPSIAPTPERSTIHDESVDTLPRTPAAERTYATALPDHFSKDVGPSATPAPPVAATGDPAPTAVPSDTEYIIRQAASLADTGGFRDAVALLRPNTSSPIRPELSSLLQLMCRRWAEHNVQVELPLAELEPFGSRLQRIDGLLEPVHILTQLNPLDPGAHTIYQRMRSAQSPRSLDRYILPIGDEYDLMFVFAKAAHLPGSTGADSADGPTSLRSLSSSSASSGFWICPTPISQSTIDHFVALLPTLKGHDLRPDTPPVFSTPLASNDLPSAAKMAALLAWYTGARFHAASAEETAYAESIAAILPATDSDRPSVPSSYVCTDDRVPGYCGIDLIEQWTLVTPDESAVQNSAGVAWSELTNGDSVRSRQRFELRIRVSSPAEVYICMHQSQGGTALIFPFDGVDTSNPLMPGYTYIIPGTRDDRTRQFYTFDSHPGVETIVVIACAVSAANDEDVLREETVLRSRRMTIASITQKRSSDVQALLRGLSHTLASGPSSGVMIQGAEHEEASMSRTDFDIRVLELIHE